jgi:hypothetical protein
MIDHKKKRRLLFLRSGREEHIDDLAMACVERGHETQVLEVSDTKALQGCLRNPQFDLVLTHNLYIFDQYGAEGKQLEQELIELGRPIVAWFLDSPLATGSMQRLNETLFGPFPKHIHHWVVDSGWIPALQERDLKVEYFPLAVGPRWMSRSFQNSSAFSGKVTFVGKPWEDIREPMISKEAQESFFFQLFRDEFFAFAESKRSPLGLSRGELEQAAALIETLLRPLFQAMAEPLSRYPLEEAKFFEALKGKIPRSLYALLLLMRGRLSMIFSYGQLTTYLAGMNGLEAWGSEGWSFFLPNQRSRRLTDDELVDCFRNSAVSFCYTKHQFVHGIHERPILIFGCGGFALTDDRKDLRDAWGSRPDFVYSNLDEVREKVDFYLKNESARNHLSDQARSWVLKSMTYQHRAVDFERLMEKIL